MKKPVLILAAFVLSLTIFAQEISHETIVVNIEVPIIFELIEHLPKR